MNASEKQEPKQRNVNDDYFELMADVALYGHERISPEQLRRQVILALKEVERDARHEAASLASELHGNIMNMKPRN